jgi:hypothetical protein
VVNWLVFEREKIAGRWLLELKPEKALLLPLELAPAEKTMSRANNLNGQQQQHQQQLKSALSSPRSKEVVTPRKKSVTFVEPAKLFKEPVKLKQLLEIPGAF